MPDCNRHPADYLPAMRGAAAPHFAQKARMSTDTLAVSHPQLREAIEFIKRNCGENIGIEETSLAVGLSRAGLDRLFRDFLDCTPRAFLIRQRMEKACQLLSETELPVKGIAPLCGIGRPACPVQRLRAYYGSTPGAYRRRKQENQMPTPAP